MVFHSCTEAAKVLEAINELSPHKTTSIRSIVEASEITLPSMERSLENECMIYKDSDNFFQMR